MDIQLDSLDFDKFTIKDKNGNNVTISIRDELVINETNIQQEFLNQSGKYAYWANLLEIIRHHSETENIKLETLGSQLNLQVRQQYKQAGEKPTKDMVESAIYTDPSYQTQLKEVKKWEYRTKQFQYIVKAFEQRSLMLTQYGADLRKTNAHVGSSNPYSY